MTDRESNRMDQQWIREVILTRKEQDKSMNKDQSSGAGTNLKVGWGGTSWKIFLYRAPHFFKVPPPRKWRDTVHSSEGHAFTGLCLKWFITEAAAIETWANSDFYSETDTEQQQ